MGPTAPGGVPAPSDETMKAPNRSLQLFGAASLVIGIIAGLGIGFAYEFSSSFRQVDIKSFFIGSTALGAAFATVNIAILALVSVWFDEIYQQVLKKRGGWVPAMSPFRIVAIISILTTLAALVGIFVLTVHPLWPKSLILAITSALVSWMLLETLLVVMLLFEHGKKRAELVQRLRDGRIAEALPRTGMRT